MRRFTQDVLPQVRAAAVLVGTPGRSQKITARLQDEKGRVISYLKYAEKDVARKMLQREREMLSSVPGNLAPTPLKHGAMGKGEALLITTLTGSTLPATLPPAGGVLDFLNSLAVLPAVPVEAHPWVRRIREQSKPELDSCFEAMAGKDWAVVIQHGDFAPWNLLRRPDGTIGAIDWEWGTSESFPYLDLAYYVLLTLKFIYRWAPPKAAEYTIRYLSQQAQLELDVVQARALIRLTAHDVCKRSLEAGGAPDTSFQMWWRAVWESRV
jgi:hypothetical protein